MFYCFEQNAKNLISKTTSAFSSYRNQTKTYAAFPIVDTRYSSNPWDCPTAYNVIVISNYLGQVGRGGAENVFLVT